MTGLSSTRTLAAKAGRLRRVALGGEVTRTLAPMVFWGAAIAGTAAVILAARRRLPRRPMPGAGDDKPAGYENPTPEDIAADGADTAESEAAKSITRSPT